MKNSIASSFAVAGALSLLLAGSAEVSAQAVVVGAHGSAQAGGLTLGCGQSILPGTTISTGSNSGAGIVTGDVYTQIAPGSVVRYSERDGEPHYELEKGSVRLVDGDNDSEAGASVGAADTEVQLADGSDVEAHALSEKAGAYAILCDWDQSAVAARGSQALNIPAGGCVISNPRENMYAARGSQAPVQLANTDGCGLPPHFGPGLPDVAAGPPGPGFPGPGAPVEPTRQPSDTPGLGFEPLLADGPIVTEGPLVDPGPGVPGLDGGVIENPPTGGTGGAPGFSGTALQ